MTQSRKEPKSVKKEARLEALREQLRSGEYHVDSEKLLEALARNSASKPN